ncbi:glycosyltransferase (plasmid) [Nostoc sp. C052]|uniref:glycosyltransferase n=1 Tax=Nostoc sp. C052 TaxID=2576902 RepID=UPI0015C40858|nr:glycosyltransferase [Nostoc sp. C052]QLE45949.1 glycosyltransferase [Nostoc sp. C052]
MRRTNQEIEINGYTIIELFNKTEVKSLLNFNEKYSLSKNLLVSGMTFSISASNLSYRQMITQEVKKCFSSKLAILFPEYRIVVCNLVFKSPDVFSEMPLHQDPSLVDELSLKSFGVWCPLIDVDEQNGCLLVVKKSHLLNSQLRPLFVFDGFPYSQDILSLLQQNYLTSIPMKSGQALIYDKRLFHGSPPNSTAIERVAAICSLIPENILTHFCYRETLTSSKIELFEVEDEFYDRYIVGQKPEGVKRLGTLDYNVDPLTPELLVEKLGTKNSALVFPRLANFEINFQPQFLEKLNLLSQKVAILVSNEFEGFSQNGGIGTYYTTLSQKLKSDGWYVILLLCQTETDFQGEPSFADVDCVFSTHEIKQVLNLQLIHHQILSTTQQDAIGNSFDYESFCCLFFTQAAIASLPDAVLYVEFPDIWGFGYRTIQAKKTGLLGDSCLIGVTTHGCFEWLREVNSQYAIQQPQWFWQAYHYEQFSYENADIAYFPSYFLKSKLESYGWKTSQAKHLPYFVPTIHQYEKSERLPKSSNLNVDKIPVVFFSRLEERKGLCTFVEAIKLLNPAVVEKIQVIFMGKIIPLQSSQLKHLDSQQYIEQELDSNLIYKIIPNLSSQEAIKFIYELNYPIVCLTSIQENFPNTGLEMGQLPVSLVVSDTGGFRETLSLIERSDSVRYFHPANSYSLAQMITEAINAYPENPLIPQNEFLQQVNQRLLNQRLEYMSQAFINSAPKEPQTPKVTIAIVCWHPVNTILECLESLAVQNYNNFDVIIGYRESIDEYLQEIIIQAQTKFPDYKYLNLDANWSLGESYNNLITLAVGEYVLQLSVEHIALPDMVEKLVTAAIASDADVVVCPQVRLQENGELKAMPAAVNYAFIDGCLLKLLEFNHNQDISALFSLKLLQEFRYSLERGLLALNWHILAAAIATGKEIAYYPYPLYITKNSSSTISSVNLAKERYYLRQYLYQIEPAKWNQRQLNFLLTGVEQLLQEQNSGKAFQLTHQNNQNLSPQSQAWMLTAQQLQDQLTQTQETLKNVQSWNQQLQVGKDWLEAQWQTWMLRAQKAEFEWERWQSFSTMMSASKFWQLRSAWLKFKRLIGSKKPDLLQLANQINSDIPIRDFVALIASQKVRFFQPEASESPVVSIISVFVNNYEYFETTYRSAINQTWQNWEWIIVNDGSTNSDAITFIESLSQRTNKIKVISHSSQQGDAAGRNTAIAQARGKYLFFLNLVDIIDPTYIEKSLLFLETHSEFSFVNSYSAIFQAEEYWCNHSLSQLASLSDENQFTRGLLYRKADFEQLGGFDADLKLYADWERWLKAIANQQLGWTIPEYLECDRRINFLDLDPGERKQVTKLIQSRYPEIFNSTVTANISLNRQPLNPQQLKYQIAVQNSLSRYNAGKRLLFFFPSLSNTNIDKFNLDLVTLLEKEGYEMAITTTLKSKHPWYDSFYRLTPDIFHLPNLLDEVYWLAFIRYTIQSRQIDIVVISHTDIAYYFLPLLRAEFPQVAFMGCSYTGESNSESGNFTISRQFSQYLDCQVLFSPEITAVEKDISDSNNSNLRICSSNIEMVNIFTEAIQTRQTQIQSEIDTELATVTLLLALR